MAHILFVEDDPMIASGLCYALEQEGHQVTHCTHVEQAKAAISTGAFHLALLDLALPDGTGHQLCRLLTGWGVPVIFLTAADDEANAVMGLELGAEDYITKPFRLRELMARIQVALRRQAGAAPATVLLLQNGLRIHTLQAKAWLQGRELELTALEYRLLLVFASHPGQVLTRTQLLEGIWDAAGSFVNDNTLTVYIKRLREKLGDENSIVTVRGLGYKING